METVQLPRRGVRDSSDWLRTTAPLARDLSRRYALTPADAPDLEQEALWYLHSAITGRSLSLGSRTGRPRGRRGGVGKKGRGVEVRNTFAFARTAVQHACQNYYRRVRTYHTRTLVDTDLCARTLETGESAAGDPASRLVDELYLEQYFEALEAALGVKARRVAANLLAPQEPEVCAALQERAEAEARRRGRQASAKHVRVSQGVIRAALGLKSHEWRRELKAIRTFTRSWLTATHTEGVACTS